MSEKISLTYENGTIKILVNDKEERSFEKLENAIDTFKDKIDDITSKSENSWKNLCSKIEEYLEFGVSINDDFKTIEFKGVKYFYKTNKSFYVGEDMIPLIGGFTILEALVYLTEKEKIDSFENIIKIIETLTENKINYRVNQLSFLVLSPSFNYGSAEYNFQTGKINKGASIENMKFSEFKDYVLNTVVKKR